MTNRKSQNSILFLTTLGVYLGLVLIGATPQVLAQAATAKQFNVKDEIGAKDKLDNDPDKCDRLPLHDMVADYETKFLWFNHQSIGDYTRFLEQVLGAYPENIDGVDISWRSVGEQRPARRVSTAVSYPFGVLDEETSRDLDREVLFLGNGFPGKAFNFSYIRNAFGNEFRFESQQIPYDAPLVRALYSSAMELQKCPPAWEKDDLIISHTELTVARDHLVITTRLPRGSLDSLLATDAK